MVVKGFCECGCGERTRVVSGNDRGNGWVKGVPLRFVNGHQRRGPRPEMRSRVDPNPAGVCFCGCGVAVLPYASEVPLVIHPRFVAGHQARKSPVDWVEEDRGFETPCWVWQRKVTRKGYGILEATKARPRAQHAHRWVYERVVGPIPEGHELHHRCEVPLCVNPAHCEPLTEAAHKALHGEARHAAC